LSAVFADKKQRKQTDSSCLFCMANEMTRPVDYWSVIMLAQL